MSLRVIRNIQLVGVLGTKYDSEKYTVGEISTTFYQRRFIKD